MVSCQHSFLTVEKFLLSFKELIFNSSSQSYQDTITPKIPSLTHLWFWSRKVEGLHMALKLPVVFIKRWYCMYILACMYSKLLHKSDNAYFFIFKKKNLHDGSVYGILHFYICEHNWPIHRCFSIFCRMQKHPLLSFEWLVFPHWIHYKILIHWTVLKKKKKTLTCW